MSSDRLQESKSFRKISLNVLWINYLQRKVVDTDRVLYVPNLGRRFDPDVIAGPLKAMRYSVEKVHNFPISRWVKQFTFEEWLGEDRLKRVLSTTDDRLFDQVDTLWEELKPTGEPGTVMSDASILRFILRLNTIIPYSTEMLMFRLEEIGRGSFGGFRSRYIQRIKNVLPPEYADGPLRKRLSILMSNQVVFNIAICMEIRELASKYRSPDKTAIEHWKQESEIRKGFHPFISVLFDSIPAAVHVYVERLGD